MVPLGHMLLINVFDIVESLGVNAHLYDAVETAQQGNNVRLLVYGLTRMIGRVLKLSYRG